MFNLQGSEIIFILLIALVVLGPEKLPGAIRKVTGFYSDFKKMSSGFQDEFKSVLDEPLREMKSTADLVRGAADPKRIAEEAEREAELEAAAAKKAKQARDTTAAMEAAGAAHLAAASAAQEPPVDVEPEVDAFADPTEDTTAGPDADAGGDVGEAAESDEVSSGEQAGDGDVSVGIEHMGAPGISVEHRASSDGADTDSTASELPPPHLTSIDLVTDGESDGRGASDDEPEEKSA